MAPGIPGIDAVNALTGQMAGIGGTEITVTASAKQTKGD